MTGSTAMKILSLVDEDGKMFVYTILASTVCLCVVDASVDSSVFPKPVHF